MSIKKLGIVHTTAALVPTFKQLFQQYLPDLDTFNIADDSLIKDVMEKGELTPGIARRVAAQIACAEQAGAEFVLVTCSSVGAAVEAATPFSSVPILRVDQPMADKAVELGSNIGVIATLPTTLRPTADLIRRRATLVGKQVNVVSELCEGAFQAASAGEMNKFDGLILRSIRKLAEQVDVIVLAQASMARVAAAIPPGSISISVLSSPALAMEYLVKLLGKPSPDLRVS